MSLPRILSPAFSLVNDVVVVQDADEVRHLTKVLRAQKGERVEIVNGAGALASGRVIEAGSKTVSIVVEGVRSEAARFRRLVLACALPKHARFEDILDMGTQLGVDEFIPLLTERGEVRVKESEWGRKAARYDKILRSALKQSRRLWLPKLHRVTSFTALLSDLKGDLNYYIPWLEGERETLQKRLETSDRSKGVMFFIGPEGDFTSAEIEAAKKVGAFPVSLGPNVLRVDTAAIFSVGLAAAHLLQ